MKNFFLVLVVMMPGFSIAQVINDPNVAVRQVGSFHSIKISNAFDLYLSQSDQEALAVSAAKPEYRDLIKAEVQDGVLTISYKGDEKWLKTTVNRKLRAYVSFKVLEKLQATGACDIIINGALKADELMIEMRGASDLKKADIYANSLTVILGGASDANITGRVSSLQVEVSGASDFKGYGLRADKCQAQANGASDIWITVNQELTAKAGGASSINYQGEAVLSDSKSSGASSVRKRS